MGMAIISNFCLLLLLFRRIPMRSFSPPLQKFRPFQSEKLDLSFIHPILPLSPVDRGLIIKRPALTFTLSF